MGLRGGWKLNSGGREEKVGSWEGGEGGKLNSGGRGGGRVGSQEGRKGRVIEMKLKVGEGVWMGNL